MAKPLIIVESPTKIKTLTKYIGKEYNVAASAGHIRDLPLKNLGVDVEDLTKAFHYRLECEFPSQERLVNRTSEILDLKSPRSTSPSELLSNSTHRGMMEVSGPSMHGRKSAKSSRLALGRQGSSQG